MQQQHELAVGGPGRQRRVPVLPDGELDRIDHGKRFSASRRRARHQVLGTEASRQRRELGLGASPFPVVDGADLGVDAQRGEIEEQRGRVASTGEGRGELRRAAHLDLPLADVVGDRVDVLVVREHGGGRLRAPSRKAREAVGAVADQRQVVGDRSRVRPRSCSRTPASSMTRRSLRRSSCTTLGSSTHWPRSLSTVQMTRCVDVIVVAGDPGRGGEAVVGLLVDHRPDRDAEGAEAVFQERELGQELRRHALARLVARVEVVAERLDHVVGGDAQVGRTLLQHHQHGAHHAPAADTSIPAGSRCEGAPKW